jgi:hypothetical protein
MKKFETKLQVIWEETITPEASQRLAAAFAMLLSPLPSSELPPTQGLDSQT